MALHSVRVRAVARIAERRAELERAVDVLNQLLARVPATSRTTAKPRRTG